MITLNNVSKQFGGTTVVNDINLSIKPGEIIGLLGPNGAGKTTTIRMIAGVLPVTSGELSINGQTYVQDELGLKQQIGYLPEDNPLYEEMTVEEHLQFWARAKGMIPAEAEAGIAFAVKNTGIMDVYYRFISELSKGYRQRVGLAQAILNRPEILLLDEPTEGLDPNQRKDIQGLLTTLKKSRTVIVSSHVLSEIAHIANRIIIIHQGSVVGDDTPQRLVKGTTKGQEIEVELVGTGVVSKLKQLSQVTSVTKVSGNLYQVMAQGKNDLRADIFKAAVKHKWILLSMQQKQRQLEDVFSELTT